MRQAKTNTGESPEKTKGKKMKIYHADNIERIDENTLRYTDSYGDMWDFTDSESFFNWWNSEDGGDLSAEIIAEIKAL